MVQDLTTTRCPPAGVPLPAVKYLWLIMVLLTKEVVLAVKAVVLVMKVVALVVALVMKAVALAVALVMKAVALVEREGCDICLHPVTYFGYH